MITPGYVKTKRGNVFQQETGKLFIFDDNSVSVLRGWPQMRAWKKTRVAHPNWIGFRPSLSRLESDLRDDGERLEQYRRIAETGQLELPLPFRYRSDGNPYGSEISRWYFETTPREVRDLLAPFGGSRWALMSFLATGGTPARELLQSAPALGFMLANNRVFHTPSVTQPLRSIRSWLQPGKKRKALAGWLGFPPTKSTLRLLKKIPHESISIANLLKLRRLLQDPEYAKMLRHQPVIDRALLAFFEPDMQEMLTVKLLPELRTVLLANLRFPAWVQKEMQRKGKIAGTWKKSEQLIWLLMRDTARMLRQQNPEAPLPKIEDVSALLQLHNNLMHSISLGEFEGKIFIPPLPGNEAIIPISNYAMLCEEGREQHNCVASYARDILDGKSAIYRVLKPERCTLELVPDHGKWVFGQLLAACNRKPKEETHQAVQQWLDEVRR